MTAAYVSGDITEPTATSASRTFTVASGNGYLIAFSWDAAINFSSISSSLGNALTIVGAEVSAFGQKTRVYRCVPTNFGSETVTVNIASSALIIMMRALVSGVASSAGAATPTTDASSPWTGNTATPTSSDNIFVSVCFNNSTNAGTNFTAGNGYTKDQEETDASTKWPLVLGYKVTATSAADGGSWTASQGSSGVVFDAVFSAAAGGGGVVNSKTVTDTVSISDTLLSSALHNRLTQDDVTIADTLIKSVITSNIRNKTASDTISLSDSLSKQLKLTRTLGDVIVVSEPGIDLQYLYNLSVAETIDLTDSMTRTLKRTRQIGDSVTITDTVAAVTSSSRVVSVTQADSIVLADSVIRSVQRTRQIADAISTNDSLLRALSLTRQNVDVIVLVDDQLKVRRYNAVISDFVDVSDSISALILGAVIYDVQIEIGVDMDPIIGVES